MMPDATIVYSEWCLMLATRRHDTLRYHVTPFAPDAVVYAMLITLMRSSSGRCYLMIFHYADSRPPFAVTRLRWRSRMMSRPRQRWCAIIVYADYLRSIYAFDYSCRLRHLFRRFPCSPSRHHFFHAPWRRFRAVCDDVKGNVVGQVSRRRCEMLCRRAARVTKIKYALGEEQYSGVSVCGEEFYRCRARVRKMR